MGYFAEMNGVWQSLGGAGRENPALATVVSAHWIRGNSRLKSPFIAEQP